MRFITLAYLVIGNGYDPQTSRVCIERPGSKVWMIGVNDICLLYTSTVSLPRRMQNSQSLGQRLVKLTYRLSPQGYTNT